jgi:predicted O-methyltransferase YrrM
MRPIKGVARRLRNGWIAVRKGLAYSELESINFQSGLGDSAYLLYGLVRSAKPKVVVEIGSARGRSACFMGMALKENGTGRLYAIDPHTRTKWNDEDSVETYDLLADNVRRLRLQEQIVILRDTSDNVASTWNLPIDTLFIDGDHSYEGVKRDWKLFSPFVNPFGEVVFHDTLWDLRPDPKYARADMGVPRFVEELRGEGYPVITLDRNFGVSLVQPVRSGVSLQGSVQNTLRHQVASSLT